MESTPPERDVVLLVTAVHAACDRRVLLWLKEAGYGDLRPSHGYVFQHLLPGPCRVTDLALKLGMTAQGASKSVIELERLGYVMRTDDAADRRNRSVSLTRRGWGAIEAGRDARAAVAAELAGLLGEPAASEFLAALALVAEKTGGLEDLLARRLRPGR